MNTGNGKGGQKNEAGIVNSVIIFRTFDLGEFFKKKNESDIHFLDNRTNNNFQKLFRYKPEEQSNKCSNAYLQDLFPETNDKLPFRFSKNDNELDEKAYRTGMVRSNLYDLCIFPKYVCNTKHYNNFIYLLFNNRSFDENQMNSILKSRDDFRYKDIKEINVFKEKLSEYKTKLSEWKISLGAYAYMFDDFLIKLSISQYGVISVFLELQLNKDAEFNQLHGTSLSDKLEKSKERLKKLYHLDDNKNGPSLITFISIIAILDFLYAIRCENDKNSSKLDVWLGSVGDIICFNKLWDRCTSKKQTSTSTLSVLLLFSRSSV